MSGPYLVRPGESDKEVNGYLPTYQSLARTLPQDAAVCELGVYEGGSLRLWKQMFPAHSVVVGVDVNPNSTWPEGTVKVVSDQQDPTLPQVLRQHSIRGYDLIVDDASHQGHLTLKAFQHLWPLVRPGGYYVVEDWCVGFDIYPTYDNSMLSFAMMLLNQFDHPENDTHFVTYQYGMIVLRKKDEVTG